jgi:arylsulfatase
MTYKVHLDGYNLLPYITGLQPKSPRREFLYFSDQCEFLNLRYENWKFVFAEQRMTGTMGVWAEPFTQLRLPKFFDLRADPYERADVTSNTYWDWYLDHMFLAIPAQVYLLKFLETFKEYPPRQKPMGTELEQALEKLQQGAGGR